METQSPSISLRVSFPLSLAACEVPLFSSPSVLVLLLQWARSCRHVAIEVPNRPEHAFACIARELKLSADRLFSRPSVCL